MSCGRRRCAPADRSTPWLIPSLLLFLALLTLTLGCGDGDDPGPVTNGPPESAPTPEDEGRGLEMELYFPGPRGDLVTVRRRLPPLEEPVAQVRQLAEAVLAGPREGEEGARPLAPEVQVGAVYLADGGVAYVDLRTDLGERSAQDAEGAEDDSGDASEGAAELPSGRSDGDATTAATTAAAPREPPAVGSTAERQIVYSLVNTLALNLPSVERVVILWNGRQRTTFAGHLDTSRPLPPEPGLIGR